MMQSGAAGWIDVSVIVRHGMPHWPIGGHGPDWAASVGTAQ
jgi:hypothetical protein